MNASFDNNLVKQSHQKLNQFVLLLMFLVPVLLPFGRLSEIPVLVLALLGISVVIKNISVLLISTTFKKFTACFALYFLLMAVASFDSYWMDKSWLITLSSLRYYFAGLAVLFYWPENKGQGIKSLSFALLVLLVFWSLDALFQYVVGFNILGITSYPGRLSGIFGMNVKLGPVLALFLPFALMQLKRQSAWVRWLLVIVILLVIILSGTRSAWLMAAFVMLAFWWTQVKGRRFILMVKSMLFVVISASVLWQVSPDFQQRVTRSAAIFQGDSAGLDFALADRLPIWQTAIEMFKAHPINGVGPRAFRKAYPEFAATDDVWIANNARGLHAHHWVLELLAETGVIGLLLFSLLSFILIGMVLKKRKYTQIWAPAVAMAAAFLPVVSLYSLFSSFWSLCLWWVLMMLFLSEKND